MTTLTPFRLFQIAKYAWARYAPEIIPFHKKPDKYNRLAATSTPETARNRTRHVGFHVEERRGWDVRPTTSTPEPEPQKSKESSTTLLSDSSSAVLSSSAVQTMESRSELPYELKSTDDTRQPMSPAPSSGSPLGDPDRKGGISAIDMSEIKRLMTDATLFTPNFKSSKNVVVLCHGLYGFSTATPIPLFPSLKLHYCYAVLDVLRDTLGCKVMVVGVKGTGSIEERAQQMHSYLEKNLPKGTGVNFVAHSMGGLDCRYVITHLKPTTYKPLSLTMIGTPNRGSPFMDWCAANIGVGSSSLAMAKAAAKAAANSQLPPYSLKSPLLTRPVGMAEKMKDDMRQQAENSNSSIFGIPSLFGSSITNYLLGLLDSPAYGNLTTHYLNQHFNPLTPDDPNVKYMSTAGRINKLSVLHPLWFPKLILDAAAERGYAEEQGRSGKDYEGNDGLVSVSSAKWGEWLGVVDNCHHWDLRGEGGLLPQGGSFDNKPEGRPDPSAPDGWDWNAVARAAEEGGARGGIAKIENLKKTAELVSGTIKEYGGKSTQVVKSSISSRLPDTPANWDMAQVGQVVDWVADLLPGSSQAASERSVGSKQMADAANEKAREEEREEIRNARQSGTAREQLASASKSPGPASMRQTQSLGPREKSAQEKRKSQRFDLGSFYGGIMVKLSEEGL